jgi:dihydrolipoamide dehydrogenase
VDQKVDVAVIGAGSAGLAAVAELRKAGKSYVLINSEAYGTTCASTGCMPSKALIQIADDFHRRRTFKENGISGGGGLRLDARRSLKRVRALRDGFVAGVLATVKTFGRRNIEGRARFVEPGVLIIGARTVRAQRVIIATGSRPIIPHGWTSNDGRFITSDDVFELETLPSSLAVVGLGANGVELGQALSRLGVKVVGIGKSAFIGRLTDPEVNRRAIEIFSREFPLWRGHEAEVRTTAGLPRVKAGGRSVSVEKILVSIGRRPNVDSLGLETLGIKLSPEGIPDFDPRTMRLPGLPIFIDGDASDDKNVQPEAVDAGRIAGFNAGQADPRRFKRRVTLRITFSQPNIALVGKSFAELRNEDFLIGEADFGRSGRALIMSENAGLLRIYGALGTGKLLGAEMVAPSGEHLAHLLALAVERGLTVFDVLQMPFYHPVLEEGLRDALRDLAGRCRGSSRARMSGLLM